MPKMNTGSEVNLESHGVYRLIYRYQGGLWRPHTVRSSNLRNVIVYSLPAKQHVQYM